MLTAPYSSSYTSWLNVSRPKKEKNKYLGKEKNEWVIFEPLRVAEEKVLPCRAPQTFGALRTAYGWSTDSSSEDANNSTLIAHNHRSKARKLIRCWSTPGGFQYKQKVCKRVCKVHWRLKFCTAVKKKIKNRTLSKHSGPLNESIKAELVFLTCRSCPRLSDELTRQEDWWNVWPHNWAFQELDSALFECLVVVFACLHSEPRVDEKEIPSKTIQHVFQLLFMSCFFF